MAAVVAILDMEQNDFGNSESPCLPDVSQQVSAWSVLEQISFEDFNMVVKVGVLDIGMERF